MYGLVQTILITVFLFVWCFIAGLILYRLALGFINEKESTPGPLLPFFDEKDHRGNITWNWSAVAFYLIGGPCVFVLLLPIWPIGLLILIIYSFLLYLRNQKRKEKWSE